MLVKAPPVAEGAVGDTVVADAVGIEGEGVSQDGGGDLERLQLPRGNGGKDEVNLGGGVPSGGEVGGGVGGDVGEVLEGDLPGTREARVRGGLVGVAEEDTRSARGKLVKIDANRDIVIRRIASGPF